jgi:predicted benzoate:H+ symporter BenE
MLLTAAVFGVGWALVGIAMLRVRVYQFVPAALILLGGLVSLWPVNTLGQVVLGVGLVLLAFSPSYRKHEGPQRHGAAESRPEQR